MIFIENQFFLRTIFFLWFFHILERSFFFLYLWQIKEYRLDRFLEEIKRRKSIIFSKFFFSNLGVLFFWFFLSVIGFWGIGKWLVFALVVLFFLHSFYSLTKKQWRAPIWTKKMIFLFAFIVVLGARLVAVFWEELLIFILLFDLFFPLFVFFCLQIIQIPVFLVKKFIIKKAKKKIESMPNLLVIGVTGSYGKTSTKEFLALILSQKYRVLKTKGNINVDIGIANFILKELKRDHEIFICEMGAYRRGEVKDICDIVKPKIGIITGINEQHLALFGSMENLLSAEGGKELIECLPKDGLIFFNARNKHCLEIFQKTKGIKKFLYGKEAAFPGGENILGAMAVAKELGIKTEEIKQAVVKIQDKFPGIKIKESSLLEKKGISIKIIDATYSANPTGVLAHLEYLKTFPGKKIIIMPCLIELGFASKKIHRQIGRKISEVCDLAIITTKDEFKEIKRDAGKKAIFLQDPQKIIEKIKSFCNKDSVILLESRVPPALIDQLVKSSKANNI